MDDVLTRVLREEEALRFSAFNEDDAWALGSLFVERARAGNLAVTIDISTKDKVLFHYSFPGTNPDNEHWVTRKKNLVNRFGHSSWYIGQLLKRDGATLEARYGVSERDYAPHGGSFPLYVAGTGIIGTVTVSGLPQEEDHALVVGTLTEYLGKERI